MAELQTVYCKKTGCELVIKAFRFNPELHSESPLKEVKECKKEAQEEPEEGLPCGECDKTYKTDSSLKAHNTKCH